MEELLFALLIFGLRVLNYSISTLRLVVITRNMRFVAALLASLEALIFAVVIANIVNDLENLINLFAYCAGAAVGSYFGMVLEARLITSYSVFNAIVGDRAHEIAQALRDAGFGVTETTGQGLNGTVTTLRSVVNKRDLPRISKLVQGIDSGAFITVEEARAVSRGWLRAPAPGRNRGI